MVHLADVGPTWLLIMTTTRKTTVRAHTKTVNGRVVEVATHETTVHTAAAATAVGAVAVSPPTVASVVPDPVSTGRGMWQVLSSVTEAKAPTEGGPIHIQIGGDSDTSAHINVATDLYPSPSGITVRVTDGAKRHDKATVLLKGETMFGAPIVHIVSGTLRTGRDGRPIILPSGSRSKGYVLTGHTKVLDMVDGASTNNAKVLNALWHAAATRVPVTVPVTVEALSCATEQHPLAVVVNHPGFGGGTVPGCVWIITSYDAEDDICDGFMWAPEGELSSEHGSCYGRDLMGEHYPGGIVKGGSKTLFRDCYDLPTDRAGAYAAIFG